MDLCLAEAGHYGFVPLKDTVIYGDPFRQCLQLSWRNSSETKVSIAPIVRDVEVRTFSSVLLYVVAAVMQSSHV